MVKKDINPTEKIRADVSGDYGRAVTSTIGSCGSGGCGAPVQKGVLVKLAGYTEAELAELPAEAAVNAFGCGNPLAFSEIKPGQTILDLGSGAGIDIILAAKKVGSTGRVIGVDMTDEMIAKARENIVVSGLKNVEVRKGIIEDLPVEDASVDWVISNCVINLSPEKERVFKEISRVLKPGGTMLVADIVAKDLPLDFSKDRQLYSSCLAGAISEEDYVAGLEKAGLTGVEIRERLVYDATQLQGLVVSELEMTENTAESCHVPSGLWQMLEGKVWSAKILARKL